MKEVKVSIRLRQPTGKEQCDTCKLGVANVTMKVVAFALCLAELRRLATCLRKIAFSNSGSKMAKQLIIPLTLALFFANTISAQVTHQRIKSANKKPVKKGTHYKPIVRVGKSDTSKVVKPIDTVTAPVIASVDSTKSKDTTVMGKIAEVIADSVKAQVKAPIVQVPVKLKSLILPGALFAYGALTLNSQGLRNLNQEIKEVIYANHPHEKREYIENTALLLPAVAVYALNISGIKGQNNLVDRSVIYGMSNGIANAIIFGVKYLGIEQRPDSSNNYSFPSGHAAEAFVSAELLRQEYKHLSPWYGVAGYAVALITPYMRMYNNKHWFSDVIAGAGVGIASTRFSYYIYPILKHWIFGSKKIRGETMILPSYKQGGGYGFTLIKMF